MGSLLPQDVPRDGERMSLRIRGRAKIAKSDTHALLLVPDTGRIAGRSDPPIKVALTQPLLSRLQKVAHASGQQVDRGMRFGATFRVYKTGKTGRGWLRDEDIGDGETVFKSAYEYELEEISPPTGPSEIEQLINRKDNSKFIRD
jgi:hypothetical protein